MKTYANLYQILTSPFIFCFEIDLNIL